MKNDTTLARPYARAAFDFAKEHNSLTQWHDQLKLLSHIANQPAVIAALADPRLTAEQHIELVEAVCQGKVGAEQKQFLRLLSEYHRLNVLEEIYHLFDAYKAEFEKVIDVRLTTATPIDEMLQRRFSEVLTKRLGRQVSLSNEVDPTIMGGAIVRAGDQVIDESVRGRLERLAETLVA